MIYLRLEEIGENSGAIRLNRKPIATFFLWATRIEILNESQRFDWQSDTTRRRFFEVWDWIHLANPAPAAIYLDALLSYIDVDHDGVTEYPGLEQGARAAFLCLLHALSGVDPTSTALEDIRKRYATVIPPTTNFEGLFCYHAINAIHATLVKNRLRRPPERTDYYPRAQEHVFFANALAKVVHKRKHHGKVLRWVLRFVIHSLSHDPEPPTSVITDCLTIVAVDLWCDVSHPGISGLRGRYVDPRQVWISLTVKIVHSKRRFRP